QEEAKPGVLTLAYRDTLSWAIRNPWKTVGLGVGVFVASLMLASTVPSVVIPRFDSGMIQVRVEIPPGTPVLESDRVLQQMSARIRELPEVEGAFTSLSGADGSAPDANVFIQLTPRDERDRSAYAIQQVLRPMLAAFPDYRSSFVQD